MNHNLLKYLSLSVLMAVPAIGAAEMIDFESNTGYKAVGVYDTWTSSPFRTGELKGNVAITNNPYTDEVNGNNNPINESAKVLGAQRSRFGSNRFGVRVDLEESFELTPEVKYVHILLHKPVEGRVMLIGLGSRTERTGQDQYTEQFWELSNNTASTDTWFDAVFPVKGAGGIDIRSLVLVPHCESPHALTEDFLFYIDDIEINNEPTTRLSKEYYIVNGDKTSWKLDRDDRYTGSISLSGSVDGNQTAAVSQKSNKLVYQDITDKVFSARPGERLTPAVGFEGSWMHSYFYIDLNNDGKFEPVITAQGTPGEGSELISYSYLDGKNSLGTSISNSNVITCPAFTLPATLAPGMYRARYKVDWDSSDPAGSIKGGNYINDNGGVIVDIMLHVHNAEVTVNDHQLNGEVLASDGSKLNAYKVAYNNDFTVKMNPEKGFIHDGMTIKCGYNFDGKEIDTYGNRQYYTYTIDADAFNSEEMYTIPAAQMAKGNVLILGNMKESPSVIDSIATDDINEQSEIYDLLGRHLNKAEHPGIYIIDGEKIFIK